MKNTLKRVFAVVLTMVMALSLITTAFSVHDPGAGTGSLVEEPEDTGNLVTFMDGENMALTAKSGTTKDKDGNVKVYDVDGKINPKRVPEVTGADAYYELADWAIMNKDGELVVIDLEKYEFYKPTKVYAIIEDTWPPYLDMKQDRSDWYYQYVRDLSIAGVVNGYEGYIFKPAGNVTWGEALKLIMLATGYEVQERVPEINHWAGGYLAKAEEDGLVEIGYVTDLQKPITRLEYAQVASKAMGLENTDIETPFADTAAQEVLNLYVAKIIEGSFDADGNRLFKPDDLIIRSEISAVIWRINQYYNAQ